MARAQGARAQMALAFETVYGTPPAGGYTRVPFASTSLGYGRDPLVPVKDAMTADGDVAHARELYATLKHFIGTHPEAAQGPE